MRIPATFGQYVPVSSPVHSLDAKTKMGLVAAFTTAVFLVRGFPGLAAMAVFVALAIAVSHVPWRIALRGIKALTLLLSFTLLAHALRCNPATVALVRVGPLAIDGPGLLEGVFFVLRVVLLVVGTSLLTLTTTPVQLTDGLERVMRPLEAVRFPAGSGAPETVTFNTLRSWTESDNAGVRYFSGTATYSKEIDVPAGWLAAGRSVLLDLGQVCPLDLSVCAGGRGHVFQSGPRALLHGSASERVGLLLCGLHDPGFSERVALPERVYDGQGNRQEPVDPLLRKRHEWNSLWLCRSRLPPDFRCRGAAVGINPLRCARSRGASARLSSFCSAQPLVRARPRSQGFVTTPPLEESGPWTFRPPPQLRPVPRWLTHRCASVTDAQANPNSGLRSGDIGDTLASAPPDPVVMRSAVAVVRSNPFKNRAQGCRCRRRCQRMSHRSVTVRPKPS
jgi:hypothetical protein